jgi:transposase
MGYRRSKLGLLIQLDPDAAARTLIGTFDRYNGNTTKTAQAYNVSLSTMKRWIVTLERQGYQMREAIEEMRDRILP